MPVSVYNFLSWVLTFSLHVGLLTISRDGDSRRCTLNYPTIHRGVFLLLRCACVSTAGKVTARPGDVIGPIKTKIQRRLLFCCGGWPWSITCSGNTAYSVSTICTFIEWWSKAMWVHYLTQRHINMGDKEARNWITNPQPQLWSIFLFSTICMTHASSFQGVILTGEIFL